MMERMMSKKIGRVLFAIVFEIVVGAFIGSEQLFAAESKNILKTYNEAVELQNEENWYTASQYFIEVVNSNPAFSDAWFRLADCSYHLGEYDLAFQYLESAEKYEKVSWNEYDFIVQDMEGHRINMVKIIKNIDDGKDDE